MKKSYMFAATSIICWSTVATITKLLLTNYNNFQLLWISSLLSALFLLVVNIVSGKIKTLKEYKLKDFLSIIIAGFPGTFLYYVFYYAGADLMSASQAFIVNYMWPIMSVVFACIILKEKMTMRKGLAIAVSFLGVGIVTGADLVNLNHNTIMGALLCLMGAVSYGLFTSLNRKIHYDKGVSMMFNYFVTFFMTSIINFVNDDLFVPTLTQLPGFAWNGIFTMGIANTLWILALENGTTAKISNLAYITPFLSLVWTSLILKEEISVNSIIGLVVIVLGIFIQLKEKNNNKVMSVKR